MKLGVQIKNTHIWANIPKMECLGRKYTISGKLAKNNVLELEISHLGLNIQKLGFHVRNTLLWAKIREMGS